MKMLVDVGNTRVKWRMAGREGRVVHLQQGWQVQLCMDWQGLPVPTALVMGSVAGAAVNQALESVAASIWPGIDAHHLCSQAEVGGVRIQYADPARFGIDRLAALVAAHHEFSAQALLVIDIGTAMTLDVLDATGLHRGGMIMPGWRLLCASLANGTAGLDPSGVRVDRSAQGFQHETTLAVQSGVRCMLQGAALRAWQQASDLLGERPVVVLSGGDRELLRFEKEGWVVHERGALVLDGLEFVARQLAPGFE